ncbi:IS110 family transposase [Acidiferrimicrobium sp. IK]|uniref:IS110 family transposase n=1 Tax=Acidiferrimicrobium sp. IK TaxID=2871700 RepID=UPI0021CB8BC9|nr:IS110 family transposase [Acidiferrimicrobium sp. IK]
MQVFVGHDWAEDHHDVEVRDGEGRRLSRARLPEGVEGVARFHALVAEHVDDPAEVVVATETDRGLFVGSLVAAGYEVYAVNPLSVARYRERHVTSGAKSDPGDAATLAELARTDRHHHRRIAGDSERAEAIKVLARAHQSLIWTRQRQVNQLRSTLREYYPAALQLGELYGPDALGVLTAAPTPSLGRTLSRKRIASAIARAGRQRRLEERVEQIQAALRAEQLAAPAVVSEAMGASVAALVAVIAELNNQVARLEEQLAEGFDQHPDAEIVRSLPGLGTVLGARVLGEFGDDPNRYSDAKARKNYAGTSPITKASGKSRVVLARYARNRRLSDACYLWAFAAITASPGARAYYDARRTGGDTHNRALRALANRLVGILHGCLGHHTLYDEHTAWGHREQEAA